MIVFTAAPGSVMAVTEIQLISMVTVGFLLICESLFSVFNPNRYSWVNVGVY